MSVVIDGSAGMTTAIGAVYNGIQSATAQASTSGTSIDFTGIPSWVKRVTVMMSSVSTNGVSIPLLKIGNGSIVSSGYDSYGGYSVNGNIVSVNAQTTGFGLGSTVATSSVLHITAVLTNVSSNTWLCSVCGGQSGLAIISGGGSITLGGVLDRVRITTVNGTDTFDAGSINILFE